jgi:serine/threonine-protein kinase HipA
MGARRAEVLFHGSPAGILEQVGDRWRFQYHEGYTGGPISLTLPVRVASYEFEGVPSFFDGLLPEGVMLQGLLLAHKLDRDDYLGQLLAVGQDLVGAVTIRALP